MQRRSTTTPITVLILSVLAVLAGAVAFADDQASGSGDEREAEEARRQQAFSDGMTTIVSDLNGGSFDRLVGAIDRDAMFDRIFGLRLIDQRVKRDFRDKVGDDFVGFIRSTYKAESEEGVKARLLLVESRGTRGRAVIRFDMPRFQANYHEYELELDDSGRVRIVDWDDYLNGYRFADRVGLSLVQAQPNKNAVRKLIDFPNVREQQLFQVMEILKSTRDYDIDRYAEIYAGLDENLKRQRAVLIVGLDTSRTARKRRAQRAVLVEIAKFLPEDPLLSLSLLDYYFPSKQFDKALEALLRVKNKLGIDDGVTNARLSSATLVLDRREDALAYADMAVLREPDLELGWWALLRARVALENYAQGVAALDPLKVTFGHALDPEGFAKDPMLRRFSQSAEYRDWYAANGSDGNAGGQSEGNTAKE